MTTPSGPTCAGSVARRSIPTWAVLWFVSLMALTVTIRLTDPICWLGSDDASYYSAAEYLVTGETIRRTHHQYGRMAMIVPIAISMWLFGASPATVVLPTLVASIVCVAAVAVLGRLVWGWWEGLCAATVVCVLPYFRLLSNVAYPDVHACLWTTLAVVLAILATRAVGIRRARVLGLGCGMAIGLSMSVKVFSLPVCLAVLAVVLTYPGANGARRRRVVGACVALGASLLFLIDGVFYSLVAGDFFYKYHNVTSIRLSDDAYAINNVANMWDYALLTGERIMMLFDPARLAWGEAAVLFLPAACWVWLKQSGGRYLALWAIGGYVWVAAVPVRFEGGLQPYPYFHGRDVLTMIVPFALCLAWTLRRTARLMLSAAWIQRGWPAVMACAVVLSMSKPYLMDSLRNPHTAKIGQAINEVIAENRWDDERDIFVTPSLYVRYRILFPQPLRRRLRVAVDDGVGQWWRDAAVDIVSRKGHLPPAGDAYLLVTPAQRRGETEYWDYGTGLPKGALATWQAADPAIQVARFRDQTIGVVTEGRNDIRETLILLMADASVSTAGQGRASRTRG